MKSTEIPADHLQILADMTVQLVTLRQNECKHLCVENAAASTFANILAAYKTSGDILVRNELGQIVWG